MITSVSDIFLGRIVKAFGIRGELKFHPSDDFWDTVLESKALMMRVKTKDATKTDPLNIDRVRPHGNSYVFKLEGIDNRNLAEGLVGSEIFVEEQRLDVALPDHVLPYQIIGMTAVDEAGTVLGEVTDVIYSRAHDVYEVTGGESSFMVPAVPEFVVSVDRDKQEMILKPIPGLIEES